MTRKLVGVTGNARRWSPSWWCIRFALFLVGCKAHRISVLNPDIPRHLGAVIISGGDDIHPSLYSEEEQDPEQQDLERDQLEIHCISSAIERDIPILGICRGAQLINVARGGSLYPDINHLRNVTSRKPHLYPHKRVTIIAPSILFNIIGRNHISVNSLHHQAVKDLGESLNIVARDNDGLVQGIEDANGKRILGVQWHPEYLFFLPAQLAIFRWLRK